MYCGSRLSAHPYRLCVHFVPVMNFTGCVLLFWPVCLTLQAACTFCACHEFHRPCIIVLACLLTPTGWWNFKVANLCMFKMDTQKYGIVISKLGSLVYETWPNMSLLFFFLTQHNMAHPGVSLKAGDAGPLVDCPLPKRRRGRGRRTCQQQTAPTSTPYLTHQQQLHN